jgi:hypothetical protein
MPIPTPPFLPDSSSRYLFLSWWEGPGRARSRQDAILHININLSCNNVKIFPGLLLANYGESNQAYGSSGIAQPKSSQNVDL